MKKTLICGVASLVLAAVPVINTFAEDVGTQTRDVAVGEVDETVYSVDLSWGDMVFDWRYNEETNSFNFQQQRGAGQAVIAAYDGYDWLNNEKNKGYIFEDESCKSVFVGEIVNDVTYYWCPMYSASGVVQLSDNSTNGRVKATASFASSDSYNWVTGRFGLWVMDEGNLVFNESENGKFQQYVDINWDGTATTHTMINLNLEKNREPASSELISTNDKIGTVTINIEPDTESVSQVYEIGDVNNDGEITATDIILMRGYVENSAPLTDAQLAAADVNLDGVVDDTDIDIMRKYIAGGYGIDSLPYTAGS